LPQVSEILAAQSDGQRLLPLSQSELQRRPNDFLLGALAQDWHFQGPSAILPAI